MTAHFRTRSIVAALMLGALTLPLSACAQAPASVGDATVAAPSSAPVQAVDLAAGETDGDVDVAVAAGSEGVGVTFREITLAPGAGTGEHCHDGQLIAVVQQGELTHYAPTHPGGVRVYREGDAIIEGADYIHEGRNEGDVDVVLWVTYVIPEGEPLAQTDLALCDG
ncbi:hypothetical protein GCM10022200_11920 [Microbacterium awajiense]|uniref:Cupin type-2 domain-containing protein n=1 Tax=Microbacterium awajiense TaxID=415214 RepID=A0ABP7AF93_9MICO